MNMKLGGIEAVTKRGADSTQNIPLKVEGYDLTDPGRVMVIGERLDTGDRIAVFLRPDRDAKERKYPRMEIENFAAGPRESKVSTEPGGVIRFDGAYQLKDEPGVFSAKWAQALSRTPDEATVIVGHVRALPPRKNGEESRQSVEVLFPDEAILVNDSPGLLKTLGQMFANDTVGSAGAYVRIPGTDDDGKEKVFTRKVSPTATSDGQGGITMDTPEVAVQKFAVSPFGKTLLSEMQTMNGDARVEVIPVTTINVGRDSVMTALATGRGMDNLFRLEGDDGHGFALGSVAVRFRKENGVPFVTEAAPITKKIYAIDQVPTSNLGVSSPAIAVEDEDDIVFAGDFIGQKPAAGPQDGLNALDTAASRVAAVSRRASSARL